MKSKCAESFHITESCKNNQNNGSPINKFFCTTYKVLVANLVIFKLLILI